MTFVICCLVAMPLSAMWYLNFMWQRWVVGGLGWMWNREYLPCNPKIHHDNKRQMLFGLWLPHHCQWYVTSILCEVNECGGLGQMMGGYLLWWLKYKTTTTDICQSLLKSILYPPHNFLQTLLDSSRSSTWNPLEPNWNSRTIPAEFKGYSMDLYHAGVLKYSTLPWSWITIQFFFCKFQQLFNINNH